MRQRRKPSPNLPSYKKAILEAQTHNISFADFRPIWLQWDETYCAAMHEPRWMGVKLRGGE